MDGTLIAAQIENVTTRKDRTLKLTIGTQELAPDKTAFLFSMAHNVIALYISPKETVSQKEIDQVDQLDPEFGGKTQSQRIRNVLYKLFEQNKEGFKDFDTYYHSKTEMYIEHLKSKISS
jgi:hypothetical protein